MFLLFHSDQSKFSVETVEQIRKLGLSKQIVIVDIDNPSLKIPSFVTCIPMIVHKDTKKTFRDDEITQVVNSIKRGPSKSKDESHEDAVTPALDHFKGMTDQFSFIDESPSNEQMMSSRIYHNISDGQDQPLPEMTSDGGNKFDEGQYDKFCSQRDRDMTTLFPPGTSGPRQR
jgi:hypothetical protein